MKTPQTPILFHVKPYCMRRIRDHGENETEQNVRAAFDEYSDQKHNRRNIQRYEAELDRNVQAVLRDIREETFKPQGYKAKTVFEKKVRRLAKAPVYDHHVEAAAIRPYQQQVYDYLSWRSPAVRPGMGTHAMFRFVRNEIYRYPELSMGYYLPMDIHHYFPQMDHAILKQKIDDKFKRGKLRRFLYKVVDSYLQGAPLGIKLAQLFGMIDLAPFDRLAMDFFRIGDDPEKMQYWTRRYVTLKILTAKAEDSQQLSRGSQALARRFERYVSEGLQHYFRFVDNFLVLHEDKTVLLIVRDLLIVHLSRDYHFMVNRDYNVRPVWMGIRLIGYTFLPANTELSKRNKQELARRVHKLRKIGLDEEAIRVKLSSRFAYAKHADSINLFKTLGMEKTLGKIIRRRKVKPPFPGMTPEQKFTFSELVTTEEEIAKKQGNGWDKKILMTAFIITDSKYKEDVVVSVQDSAGGQQSVVKSMPGKVLAFRFKKILQTFVTTDERGEESETYVFEKVKDRDGHPTEQDAEYYSWSGSKVMIDQATKDFTLEDLPSPTYVTQFEASNGKKYTKFT